MYIGIKLIGKRSTYPPLATQADDREIALLDMSASLLSVATDLDFSQLSLLKYPPVKIDSKPRNNSNIGVIDHEILGRSTGPIVAEVDEAVTERSVSPSLSELSQVLMNMYIFWILFLNFHLTYMMVVLVLALSGLLYIKARLYFYKV
jgi:hypothetical protein